MLLRYATYVSVTGDGVGLGGVGSDCTFGPLQTEGQCKGLPSTVVPLSADFRQSATTSTASECIAMLVPMYSILSPQYQPRISAAPRRTHPALPPRPATPRPHQYSARPAVRRPGNRPL